MAQVFILLFFLGHFRPVSLGSVVTFLVLVLTPTPPQGPLQGDHSVQGDIMQSTETAFTPCSGGMNGVVVEEITVVVVVAAAVAVFL